MTIRLVTLTTVADVTAYHTQSIRRMIRDGRFPKPIRVGGPGSALRFRQDEVEAWLAAKSGAR